MDTCAANVFLLVSFGSVPVSPLTFSFTVCVCVCACAVSMLMCRSFFIFYFHDKSLFWLHFIRNQIH